MDKGETRRLGQHLKLLREERKLTLGGVETLSEGFGERITKTYLFRVERGKTVPTIPRLRALAKVYRVKLSMLLDILEGAFEEQEKEARLEIDLEALSYEEARERGIEAERQGDFSLATLLYRTALDRTLGEQESWERSVRVATVRHDLALALQHSGRLDLARQEAEIVLEQDDLPAEMLDKFRLTLSIIYRKLGHLVLSQDVLQSLLSRKDSVSPDTLSAAYSSMGSTLIRKRPEEAASYYRSALSLVKQRKRHYEECVLRYNIALAEEMSGNLGRAGKSLERAMQIADARDYTFWKAKIQTEIGKITFLQGSSKEARSALFMANDLARRHDYFEQLFINHFYLRRIAISECDGRTASTMLASLRYFAMRLEENFEELAAFKKELEILREERQQE